MRVLQCKVCHKSITKWYKPKNYETLPPELKLDSESCCSVSCFKRLHPQKCVGCGEITHRKGLSGYCSVGCLFKYNSKLYYEKCIPDIDKKPKQKFNKYGLIYEPLTEDEVLFLFAKIHKRLGFNYVKIARNRFPDCIAITDKGNTVRIEFEYNSKRYHHDINGCDYIICWIHDWIECPIKVISLKEYLDVKNYIHSKTLFDY